MGRHRSRRDQSTGPSEQPPPEKLPDNHPSKSKHLHCMVAVVSSPNIPHIHHGFAWRWCVFTGERMAEKDLYNFSSQPKKREEMRGAGLFKTPPGTNFGW